MGSITVRELSPLEVFQETTGAYVAAIVAYKRAMDCYVEAVGLEMALEELDAAMQRICNLPCVAPESVVWHGRFMEQLKALLPPEEESI